MLSSSSSSQPSSSGNTAQDTSISTTKEMDSIVQQVRRWGLFRETPLIYSEAFSRLCQQPVYLKLDCLQSSGSFKDRGMAVAAATYKAAGCTTLISSSGGNAGLAVATVGKALGMQVQVIVPVTTKPNVVQKLQGLGADVTVTGDNWNAADVVARARVQQLQQEQSGTAAAYMSPYDNPLLWQGHATVVEEIYRQCSSLPETNAATGDNNKHEKITPANIIVSVGGGGLLCGVLEGLSQRKQQQQQQDSSSSLVSCRVIAAETAGAASFAATYQAGTVTRLAAITSVATSLGALEVTPEALVRSQQYGNVQSAVCTDAEAVEACWLLAQEHRLLVEPACGAALAVVTTERLRKTLQPGPVVIEVCGGSGVTIELMQDWKRQCLEVK